jgi:hypothetical protein
MGRKDIRLAFGFVSNTTGGGSDDLSLLLQGLHCFQSSQLENSMSSSNTFSNSQPTQINLARRRYESPLFVDIEAFFEFSFWMAEELLDLEAAFKQKNAKPKCAQLPASIQRRLNKSC